MDYQHYGQQIISSAVSSILQLLTRFHTFHARCTPLLNAHFCSHIKLFSRLFLNKAHHKAPHIKKTKDMCALFHSLSLEVLEFLITCCIPRWFSININQHYFCPPEEQVLPDFHTWHIFLILTHQRSRRN